MRLYGTEMGNKKGHWMCEKCKSWVENRAKQCPWCGNKREDVKKSEEYAKNEPSELDNQLWNFFKSATEQQKQRIMRFIEDEL